MPIQNPYKNTKSNIRSAINPINASNNNDNDAPHHSNNRNAYSHLGLARFRLPLVEQPRKSSSSPNTSGKPNSLQHNGQHQQQASRILSPKTTLPAPASTSAAMTTAGVSSNKKSQSSSNSTLSSKNIPMTNNKFSGNLPIVERLPTRNVSFSSGEIVTVSELANYCLCSSNGRRSINNTTGSNSFRITGTILYVDSKAQWLILGDPLAQKKVVEQQHLNSATKKTRTVNHLSNKNNTSTPKSNIPKEKRRNHLTPSSLATGKKRKLVPVLKKHTPNSSIGGGLLKQRAILSSSGRGGLTSSLGSRSSIRNKLTPQSLFTKRPSLPSKKMPSDERMVDEIIHTREETYVNGRASLVVVSLHQMNSTALGNLSKGELLMIIGEVNTCSWGKISSSIDTDIDASISRLDQSDANDVVNNENNDTRDCDEIEKSDLSSSLPSNLKNILQLWAHPFTSNVVTTKDVVNIGNVQNSAPSEGNTTAQNAETTESQSESHQSENSKNIEQKASYLQARIVRNAAGTDIKLYQEALLLRRQYLKTRGIDTNPIGWDSNSDEVANSSVAISKNVNGSNS